jgi:hypothetical protein
LQEIQLSVVGHFESIEAGLTAHVWTIEELVNLMEPKSILKGLKRLAKNPFDLDL